ncbi:hypothetical protein AMATHDRAFT_3144 [Amanita thiersii Skay4041]|uniref:C2H2-type domain-containing protein n=1 Tax=Amanita thiersii Skay4041 TaxID=703135 RepID=A0A2A9NSK4_9AGAR|nr:hypothetical protein AMATHDRAFT_3144 [Amanita thiersii Skay4041]
MSYTSFHSNVLSSTGEKPNRCRYSDCTAAFGDPSSRSRHEKEVHKLKGHTHRCPFHGCTTTIKRASAFSTHVENKHGVTLTPSQVASCVVVADAFEQVALNSYIAKSTAGLSDVPRAKSTRNTTSFEEHSNISQAIDPKLLQQGHHSAGHYTAPYETPLHILKAASSNYRQVDSLDYFGAYDSLQYSTTPWMYNSSQPCLDLNSLSLQGFPNDPGLLGLIPSTVPVSITC